VWDTQSGERLAVFDSSTEVVALSPDGELIVGADGSVWELATGVQIASMSVEDDRVRRLLFTPDGRFVVRHEWGGEVTVWAVDPEAARRAQAAPPPGYPWPSGEKIDPLNIARLRPQGRFGGLAGTQLAASSDWRKVAAWDARQISVYDLGTRDVIAAIDPAGLIADVAYLGSDFLLVLLRNRGVERWRVSTLREQQDYDVQGSRVVASPDGKLFAVQEKNIQVVDVVDGRILYRLGSTGAQHDFRFSPDGRTLAIAAGSGVGLWDMQTGRLTRQLAGHGASTHGLVFTADGTRLLSASGDIWDLPSGRLIAWFEVDAEVAAITSDGSLVAASDGSLWDGNTGQYVGDLGRRATALAFAPDDQRLIWRDEAGEAVLYGIHPIVAHPRSTGGAPSLRPLTITSETARDLRLLGWWGKDALLSLRRTNQSGDDEAIVQSDRSFRDIALSPGGLTLTALAGSGIERVDPQSGHTTDSYAIFLNPETIRELAYLGEHLLLLKERAGLERWDLDAQRLVQRYNLTGHDLVVSPDGAYFALQATGHVLLVAPETGEVLQRIPVSEGPGRVQFSPDGKLLAIVRPVTVELWQVETGRRVRILHGRGTRLGGLAFTPDGERLLASSGEIWQVATGALAASFDSPSTLVAVNADGEVAVTNDGGLWETRTGRRVGTLVDLRGRAAKLGFTSDDKILLWLTPDGRTYAWGIIAQTRPPAAAPQGGITAANAAQVRRLDHLGRGRLLSALWSPDEKYLAVNTLHGVEVYETPRLARAYAAFDAMALAFDGDGDLLIGGEQPLQIVDVRTGEASVVLAQTGVVAATYSPTGALLAVGGQVVASGGPDGLALLSIADDNLRMLDQGPGRYERVDRLAFTPDGKYLVVSYPGAIAIWDVATGEQARAPISGNRSPAALSPDGKVLAYLAERFVIENLETGGVLRRINADGTPFFSTLVYDPRLEPMDYIFTRDGRLLVFYRKVNRHTAEATVALIEWDVAAGVAQTDVGDLINLSQLTGLFLDDYADEREYPIPAFGLGPREQLFFSLTGDGVVRLWRFPSGVLQTVGAPDTLDLMAPSPDGGALAVPDALGAIELYDIGAAELRTTLRGPWYPTWLAYSAASILILLQPDGSLDLISMRDGDTVERFAGESSFLPPIAVTSDGRLFAAWLSLAGVTRLQVYSLSTDGPLLDLGRYPWPDHVSFSPDGGLLAVVRRGEVELWSIQENRILRTLPGVGKTVGQLVFAPDGSRLIAASGEIWDVASGRLIATFDSTTEAIRLSPNGEVILGGDGTMWKASDGQPIDVLRGLRLPAVDFAFTPDGRRVIWQVEGGVVEVWGLGD